MSTDTSTETIQAIPTTYSGTQFRSRLEARFAEWLDKQEVEGEYEPKHFTSDKPNGYIPDFYVPCIQTYIEVKPSCKYNEIRMFWEHIIRAEKHWICVDQLYRDNWTILKQNYTCGIYDMSDENLFMITLNENNKQFGYINIVAKHITISPSHVGINRLWKWAESVRQAEKESCQKPAESPSNPCYVESNAAKP